MPAIEYRITEHENSVLPYVPLLKSVAWGESDFGMRERELYDGKLGIGFDNIWFYSWLILFFWKICIRASFITKKMDEKELVPFFFFYFKENLCYKIFIF